MALSTLAARSAVPAEVTVTLTARPPDATASALYFAVAELLTNIARHAARDPRRASTCTRRTTTLRLDGDRRRPRRRRLQGAGTGLAGLARRAAALDGTLAVDSPPGGPTTVTMTLPWEGC